jgi:hypothetical protein
LCFPALFFALLALGVSGKNYNRPRILLPILYRTVIQFLPKAAIIILINLVPPYSPAFPFPTSLQGHQALLDPTLYLPSVSTVSLLKETGHYSL